ncbi:MAG: acetyl-CoA carboxylase biotin carboxyl carrier protein subunit [Proteobacteria bacterium]|nr:MAG: acetyl-CoA carboxylase biotin carboxyl carrier protein subunit [Pseudomonadota bacterium]
MRAVAVDAPAAAAAHAAHDAGPGDVVAPVGGVVAWVAPVGHAVREGERVATLEAMKMQTPVVATRAGSVARVLVKEGDPVEAGQPLVTLG